MGSRMEANGMTRPADGPSQPKRQRAIAACARCRKQKLKCDGEQPCARCTRLRVICKSADESTSNNHFAQREAETPLKQALARIAQLEADVNDIRRKIGSHNSNSSNNGEAVRPKTAVSDDGNQDGGVSFPAPFTEVAFDKVSLENRQVTRANSPVAAEDQPGNLTNGLAIPKDLTKPFLRNSANMLDPIESGVVDEIRGQYLLDFYMSHCYNYLPFFESDSPVSLRHLQRVDGFLMSAMLAVASRYAESHSLPQSDSSKRESEELCRLAELHLGATLVKSRHSLGDVQAVIMLHAWSLRAGGKGSDPWILSGHAFRLAKRLSIDRISVANRQSVEHREARRTWLLLCASDCFPSLGFGRPASPRENLESCAQIVKELTDLFVVEGVDIGCEAYIACQVQLASISRQLLDWVQAPTHSTKPGIVWDRYSMLKQQIDDCDRHWDTPRVGGYEQRRSARLFRLHIKLCLATFALRLSSTAHPASGGNSGIMTGSDIGRSSVYSGSPASISIDHHPSSSFERDRHRAYRQACMEATYDMIMIQSEEPCLAFMPDYLITALGQAVIAFVGLLEDEAEDEVERKRSYYHRQVGSLVQSTLRTLSHFDGSRTGLSQFLSCKIKERIERSTLSLGEKVTAEINAVSPYKSMGSPQRPPSASQPQTQNQHYNQYIQQQNTPQQQSYNRPYNYQHRQQPMAIAAIAPALPMNNNQNMPFNQHGVPTWADPDPHWGDFSQWWDIDDPLRLLFGAGADELARAANMGQP